MIVDLFSGDNHSEDVRKADAEKLALKLTHKILKTIHKQKDLFVGDILHKIMFEITKYVVTEVNKVVRKDLYYVFNSESIYAIVTPIVYEWSHKHKLFSIEDVNIYIEKYTKPDEKDVKSIVNFVYKEYQTNGVIHSPENIMKLINITYRWFNN